MEDQGSLPQATEKRIFFLVLNMNEGGKPQTVLSSF